MNPFQQATARNHAYTLFSLLYRHGITADLLPYLQTIPQLAAALPDPFDPDQAAADHHNLFAFNIFPNAAIFLDPSRLLGGPLAAQHDALYRLNGFIPDSAVEPDHLSQCLNYLAHLSQAEAQALQTGQSPTLAQIQQHHFLHNYLLPWLIPCAIAIQNQNHPFYTPLAHLTLALTTTPPQSTKSQMASCEWQGAITSYQLPITNYQSTNQPNQPTPPLPHLLTPVLSGLYLSRTDITRLARSLNLPHGFGDRHQMLQTVFQSAEQYDAIPQLLTALSNLVRQWRQAYHQTAQTYPTAAPHLPPWQSRLVQTETILNQLQQTS